MKRGRPPPKFEMSDDEKATDRWENEGGTPFGGEQDHERMAKITRQQVNAVAAL